ncbi:MAG: hypothetical protein U5L96_06355 [Owenweeksia sp.]|nr:hypothetical protein [Owenweeksia sp.]
MSWFFDQWLPSAEINDYKLKDFDFCPTVATAKVKNKGRLAIPYSITGYKNNEPVLTEWFNGTDSSVTHQIHYENYDYLSINDHHRNAEWNQKDNNYTNRLVISTPQAIAISILSKS